MVGSGVNRSTATDGSARQVALAEVMSGLARAAAAASPVVAGCALTYATPSLATDRDLALTLLIRGGSDDFALAMESIQDQIGEGPSMAARTGGVAAHHHEPNGRGEENSILDLTHLLAS